MKEYLKAAMKSVRQIILCLIILVISISFNDLFSQNGQTKPTRQSSFEAFSDGNYERAYKEFSELLITYSKDPLYKYYSGVCLVKLKREPERAVTFLQQSLQGVAVVRNLPSDVNFYLGRAQQMSGRFIEAVGSYNLYTEQVGRKSAREQSVPELIQQCNEKKGQLAEPEIVPDIIVESDSIEITQEENIPVKEVIIQQPDEVEISAQVIFPDNYEVILDEALDFQFKADSLYAIAGEQKKELEKLPVADKPALEMEISDNELLAASFQKSADQKFGEAQIAMNPLQEEIPPNEALQKPDLMVIEDSIGQLDKEIIIETEIQSDTIKEVVPVIKRSVDTYSLFDVLAEPVTDPDIKIIIDPEMPEGLVYRIQVAVFRNPVAPVYFEGITPVYGFKVSGADITNYYAGMFRKYSDADKALAVVKTKGFSDAFVVAFFESRRISIDRAAILEQEWGQKTFRDIISPVPEALVDTVPPTLSFRVEVMRSSEPLEDDIVEGIKKIAGNRGFDMQSLDDGSIVYLIGKFITFESAEEFTDLLIRNGYREAQVAAWLGNIEIPLETAKQLFENL